MPRIEPFIRWAGGKSWFVPYLLEITKSIEINHFHEPFLGGAAAFLAIEHKSKAYLSDINEDLINAYVQIRDNAQEVVKKLKSYKNTEEDYYQIRANIVNDPIENAARFIYLNQTSYNGLYRVNKLGNYNVPYGFRTNWHYDEQRIYQVCNKLKNADLKCGDFETNKYKIKKNDLVFLDPPYTVSHNDNGFIEYNKTLRYVKKYAEDEWNKSDKEGSMITMNRGVQAIIRVINDIVNFLIDNNRIDPKTEKLEKYFREVEFYLDPLIDYLNNMSAEERKDLRGYFGGGADTRFWRAYQKAVADQRSDFKPAGLADYLENEAKQFNQDSVQYILEIKQKVKSLFESALASNYGSEWMIRALPKQIYTRAKGEADDKNYDLISSGHSGEEISLWECVTLSECKTIATLGSHWTDIFEKLLTRPEEEKIAGGKEAKTEWLTKTESISNKLQKVSYSVSSEEFEFLKSVHIWLCQ